MRCTVDCTAITIDKICPSYTLLLSTDYSLSPSGYLVITHTLPVADNLLIKTLVARRLQTNLYAHQLLYVYVHAVVPHTVAKLANDYNLFHFGY